jgi:tetratricopeptide (TPR) repeat protein
MKFVSTVSLGLLLALGTVGSIAPAFAAKKEKAPEGPKFVLGKEFRAALGTAQTDLKAGKYEEAKTKLAATDIVATTPDEKYVAAAVRLELATALKDQKMQATAINAMIASGSTPAADLPKFYFYAGEFAYVDGNYPEAIRLLSESDRLGYKSVDLLLRLAEGNFKANKLTEGLGYIERAIASEAKEGRAAPETWYARAASMAFKAKASAEVSKWTRAQVKAYPSNQNWRSALVTYRDSTRLDGQVQLDLFRLMHDTKSLAGERDYYEYAALATERALPGEAKTVIEEGYALGTVSKTSQAVRERLAEANSKIPADKASVTSDEKRSASSVDGKLAANTANAFLAYGDYAKAIDMFTLSLKKGGVDADTINTRLGIALARTGRKAEAKSSFALVKGTRKELSDFWTLWIDLNP